MPRSGLLSPNHLATRKETIAREDGSEKQQQGAVEMVGDPSPLSTTTKGLNLQTLNLPHPTNLRDGLSLPSGASRLPSKDIDILPSGEAKASRNSKLLDRFAGYMTYIRCELCL
ncbi:hypothetical protein TIFTF001_016979 [Ficus carica]|uniref:Uncharacterized protein n=1 Tax=Ficus carica TaxID=3494 RepID=A0AA88A1B6_FICCA|nr:hypothetical protein TIFTF001_016979 [Ficus carica]